MKQTILGFDSYNLAMTYEVGRTVCTAGGGLNEHIPIVIIIYETDNTDRKEILPLGRG